MDSDPGCVCCGLHYGGKMAACGHWYCDICVGRGHHEGCCDVTPETLRQQLGQAWEAYNTLRATVAKQQAAIDVFRAFLEAERPAGVRMRDLPDWDEMMVDTVLLAEATAALDALKAKA